MVGCILQPLVTIRLSAYLRANTQKVKRFGLIPVRSPLLGELRFLSIPVANKMFQFTTFPPPILYIQIRVTVYNHGWVSPFGHPRVKA